jgi:hypothetical protein
MKSNQNWAGKTSTSFRAGEQTNRLTNICEGINKEEGESGFDNYLNGNHTAASDGREQVSALDAYGNTGSYLNMEAATDQFNLGIFCRTMMADE